MAREQELSSTYMYRYDPGASTVDNVRRSMVEDPLRARMSQARTEEMLKAERRSCDNGAHKRVPPDPRKETP